MFLERHKALCFVVGLPRRSTASRSAAAKNHITDPGVPRTVHPTDPDQTSDKLCGLFVLREQVDTAKGSP